MTEAQKQRLLTEAFKQRSRLYNFIRKRVAGTEDAKDIMQDTLYQLVDGIDQLESLEKITAWLFTVARNKIIDLYRKKRPVTVDGPLKYDFGDDQPSFFDSLPDISQMPDSQINRSILTEAIELAIDELPEKLKNVFVMHEIEDKSFKEIHQITGVPMNTLISRKHYAIHQLRKKLVYLYNEMEV
ncbi:sigma-70 family RNA polymerase sigma factor [candidate division KSB1 bacterium]|nr:sigma-70 family RNA polymerase sigma factor [candidate division KSB1 bacterium]